MANSFNIRVNKSKYIISKLSFAITGAIMAIVIGSGALIYITMA